MYSFLQELEQLQGFLVSAKLCTYRNERLLLLPSGTFELFGVLGPGKLLQKTSYTSGWEEIQGWHVGGLHRRAYEMRAIGEIQYYSLQFKPDKIRHFTEHSLNLFKDGVHSFKLFFSETSVFRNLDSLEASHDRKIMRSLNDGLLRAYSKKEKTPFIEQALLIAEGHKWQISPNQLADELNISSSYLRLLFNREVGLSPKQYLKTLKTTAALSVSNPKSKTLTHIAYSGGFYDQAHFIHSCRTMTGLSPQEYFSIKQ